MAGIRKQKSEQREEWPLLEWMASPVELNALG